MYGSCCVFVIQSLFGSFWERISRFSSSMWSQRFCTRLILLISFYIGWLSCKNLKSIQFTSCLMSTAIKWTIFGFLRISDVNWSDGFKLHVVGTGLFVVLSLCLWVLSHTAYFSVRIWLTFVTGSRFFLIIHWLIFLIQYLMRAGLEKSVDWWVGSSCSSCFDR